jgi:hypothetical protein
MLSSVVCPVDQARAVQGDALTPMVECLFDFARPATTRAGSGEL